MKIHAMTVCVNYSDYLLRFGHLWRDRIDTLVVVTSESDHKTAKVCDDMGICAFHTDAFYLDGASFNKGRAMQEAIDADLLPWCEWWLFFDPDIEPPSNWRVEVEHARPQPGKLYGAHRWQVHANGREPTLINDREWPGYFQLFHTRDPAVRDKPLLDRDWLHAGNYDSTFQSRWGAGHASERKVRLPLRLLHHGEIGNWWGRGPDARKRMEAMYAERRRHGGRWQHERIGHG